MIMHTSASSLHTPTQSITAASPTLRGVLWFIAAVQFVLGIGFLVHPQGMAASLGLPEVPEWANWMFGMMAARFLAMGYGMVVAARDPWHGRPWMKAMIAIQAIDWAVTLLHLWQGHVSLAQVNTAAFLPVLFIAALLWLWPREPR
jgi:hypothetical protein